MLFWTFFLLSIHVASLAAPWWAYTQFGPLLALVTALALAGGWLWAASVFQPAGFKLGAFALGILLNVGGVAISWLIYLL